MKKILLIVLTITLMLSLCAGCGNSSQIKDDDFDEEPEPIVIGGTSDDDSKVDDDTPPDYTNDGWPAILPPYPDGDIAFADPYGFVNITMSSRD